MKFHVAISNAFWDIKGRSGSSLLDLFIPAQSTAKFEATTPHQKTREPLGANPAWGDMGGMLGLGAPAISCLLTMETRDAARVSPRIRAAERAMPLWADTEAPRKQAQARPGRGSEGRSS